MTRVHTALLAGVAALATAAHADLLALNPTADARILSIFPDSNFATDILATYHAPGNAQRTLIQFDVGSVPAGATINNATLRLYGRAFAGAITPTMTAAYRVATPWVEAGTTWNAASSGNPWTQAGGDLVGTGGVPLTDPYATWSGNQSGSNSAWYELNVTNLAIEHYLGTYPNYGIGLVGDVGNELVYVQREAPPGYQYPELVIDYTPVPEPASLLASVIGALGFRRR